MGLAVVQSNSLGAAYQLLAQFKVGQTPFVYDLIPQGYGATLLIRSSQTDLEKILNKNSDQYSLDAYIDSDDESVLRALYSVEYAPLSEILLVVEGPKAADLLKIGFLAGQAGLPLVDLKIPRGTQASGHLLVTAQKSQMASFKEQVQTQFKSVLVTEILASEALIRFFDLSPTKVT